MVTNNPLLQRKRNQNVEDKGRSKALLYPRLNKDPQGNLGLEQAAAGIRQRGQRLRNNL